jgi:tetratricopeptide (TPR) repeat protein
MYAANLGQLDLIIRGYSAAIERRDRLTERERYFTLGDYHLIVTSEPAKAAAAYEALLERYPEEREALNNLAILYGSLGQRQKAASLLQRAIAIDSLYMPAHVNLILLQIAMKQWPQAQATYERATRQLPSVARIWAVGIWLAEQRGDYATAQARARALDKQFGADPNWRGFAKRELATVAAVHGKVRDAERYLREAMAARAEASRPDDYLADAILLASVIAAVAGEPGRGIWELQRALTRYPLDSLRPMDRPYFGLADVNALAARADRARVLMTEYESAVEPLYRRRAKADVTTTWGRIALAERRWQDAIASLRAAASGGSLSALIMPDLGRAYDLAGEADSAIALHERYLATPDAIRSTIDATELGRVNRRLGELYEQRGDLGKAADSYSRFIELWKDCDPDLRPQVADVRRRLAELAKEAPG